MVVRVISNVAVLVSEGAEPFGVGQFAEVFGDAEHPEDETPTFDFAVCTEHPGRVSGASGFDLHVEHGLDRLAEADLVCVASQREVGVVSPAVVEALRAAVARGARVLASCTSVFTLGAAGLLDGRRCTTHWRHAEQLARRFPLAEVTADVLYVEDGPIVTGAGSAAGMDACLHVIRSEFGGKVAAAFARRIVVPPHRDGGQAQYVRSAVPECTADTLSPVLAWMLENLDSELSVDQLAARALMSPRTFARRFRDETGTTPHQWLIHQRVLRAEELLEETTLSIDEVARRSGFGNPATLRNHFGRVRGVSPGTYRRRFGCAVVEA
jgi:transcriptional regulator GlxA family with amidase domain